MGATMPGGGMAGGPNGNPPGRMNSAQLQQQPPPPQQQQQQPPQQQSVPLTPVQALALANESTWLLMGAVAEQFSDLDRALAAYEHALRHNPLSISALTQVAGIARAKDDFAKAVDFFQRVLNISQDNGEIWGALGHCYLMMDDLQKAYTAYQQALYHLPNPKEPKLWYGIGILYDRYGSLEHAEEAFSSVLRMEQNFEKANEIYFRLGIIYKQQNKYTASLDCFRYILKTPPKPLTEIDIWFQLGHVHEQQKEYGLAKEAYERVLAENPDHSKVLQQLGWLYHQREASFASQELAVSYLERSLNADRGDSQTWYLLGRVFMSEQRYNKAYEYYQQAVYRDGRNPTFWCSIGVLYYQINQFRDALDAYSRAIRLNPYISEVWFDLGSLYESCNNQIADAIDAYGRALDLDPTNETIKSRLALLKNLQINGGPAPVPPPPQDVHPTAYNNAINQSSSEELRAGMGVVSAGGTRLGSDLGPAPPALQAGSARGELPGDLHRYPAGSGPPAFFNPYYPAPPPGAASLHPSRGPSPPAAGAYFRGPLGDERAPRSVGSMMDVDRPALNYPPPPPPPPPGSLPYPSSRNLPNGRPPFDATRNTLNASPHNRHADTYPQPPSIVPGPSQAAYTNPYPPYIQAVPSGPMGVRPPYGSKRGLPPSATEAEWERSREKAGHHGGQPYGGQGGYHPGGSHGQRSPFESRRRSEDGGASSEMPDRSRPGSGGRSPFPPLPPSSSGFQPQHPFHGHPTAHDRARSPSMMDVRMHDAQAPASMGRRYDPTMDSVFNIPPVTKHRRPSLSGRGNSRMTAEEEEAQVSPPAPVKETGSSRKRKGAGQAGGKEEGKKPRRSRNTTASSGATKAEKAEKAEREKAEKDGKVDKGHHGEREEKGEKHGKGEKGSKRGDGSLKVTLSTLNSAAQGRGSLASPLKAPPSALPAALRYVDENYDDDEGSTSDAARAADLLMGLAGGFSFSSQQSPTTAAAALAKSQPNSLLKDPKALPSASVPASPAPPLFPAPPVTSIHHLTSPIPSSIPKPPADSIPPLPSQPTFSEEPPKKNQTSHHSSPMDVTMENVPHADPTPQRQSSEPSRAEDGERTHPGRFAIGSRVDSPANSLISPPSRPRSRGNLTPRPSSPQPTPTISVPHRELAPRPTPSEPAPSREPSPAPKGSDGPSAPSATNFLSTSFPARPVSPAPMDRPSETLPPPPPAPESNIPQAQPTSSPAPAPPAPLAAMPSFSAEPASTGDGDHDMEPKP